MMSISASYTFLPANASNPTVVVTGQNSESEVKAAVAAVLAARLAAQNANVAAVQAALDAVNA